MPDPLAASIAPGFAVPTLSPLVTTPATSRFENLSFCLPIGGKANFAAVRGGEVERREFVLGGLAILAGCGDREDPRGT
jgi:hypothetical protein